MAAPTVHSSAAEVWYLKEIQFGPRKPRSVKIITQNFNGPCSFIAICNILILRGDIEILPPTRHTVSYEFLSQLVAEYLLKRGPDVDISAALTVMPLTQKGMDLNPVFTSAISFRPSKDTSGGELKLFSQAGINLVHGWLVDPEGLEAQALSETPDYDSAANLVAEADHLTEGQLVPDRAIAGALRQATAGSSKQTNPGVAPHIERSWSQEERLTVERAYLVRQFLNTTRSQLTYHGLFHLVNDITPGSLVALFRNSHLSVLYKRPSRKQLGKSRAEASSNGITIIPRNEEGKGEAEQEEDDDDDNALYSLVTDTVFLKESSIVWERLEDVDGGWSTFVDSSFIKATPVGGDFVGYTAEEVEQELAALAGISNQNDVELARQLQAEEHAIARQSYKAEAQRRQTYMQAVENIKQDELKKLRKKEEKKMKKKGKGDCIIM